VWSKQRIHFKDHYKRKELRSTVKQHCSSGEKVLSSTAAWRRPATERTLRQMEDRSRYVRQRSGTPSDRSLTVGLRLSDEAVKVVVVHRLGCRQPHTCMWKSAGRTWDAWTTWRKSVSRQQACKNNQKSLDTSYTDQKVTKFFTRSK